MRRAMLGRLIPDRFVPLLLAAMLMGWLLPVSGMGLGAAQKISSVSIFALFFLHGLRLPRGEVYAAARSWKVQSAMLGFTFVALPFAGLMLDKALGWMLPAALVTGLIYCASLPSTVQSAISYASMAGGNAAASVVGATLSNLLGIVLTPALLAMLLGTSSSTALGSDVILRIAETLLLPFALGQISQHWLRDWAARQKVMLSFFDRLVILIAVYVAFSNAANSGSLSALDAATFAKLLLLIALLLAFAFGGAWGLGRLLALDRADRASLVFAGAQKSIVTGAPMAAILFGKSAGLILLPAIIYHMAQLLLSAPIAARLKLD